MLPLMEPPLISKRAPPPISTVPTFAPLTVLFCTLPPLIMNAAPAPCVSITLELAAGVPSCTEALPESVTVPALSIMLSLL